MASIELEYSILPPEKSKEASDFLIENFFLKEPISRASGLTTDQVKRWLPHQIQECLKQNCSFQAIDKSSGKIVGIAINILVEKNLNDKSGREGRGLLEILDPGTEPVMVEIAKFLKILNQVPDIEYKAGVDANGTVKTLNCIYLSVLESFGGQGIGKQLVQKYVRIAKEKNVNFLQVDTTSEFSYKIFHKHCGFPVILEIPLFDYIKNLDKIDNGVHKYGRILLKHVK